jgi:hypothetical protein
MPDRLTPEQQQRLLAAWARELQDAWRRRVSCEAIGGPHLMPGWACCRCAVYNNTARPACKQCGHARCGT